MRVVIAGSSGLIGTALRRRLEAEGHSVVRLVRREPLASNEVRWDPSAAPDPGLVDGAGVVVNLAGADLGARRWTPDYRRTILTSRTNATDTLAVSVAKAANPPRVLLSASGIRYYGVNRGNKPLDESTPPVRDGFLPLVASLWEAATEPASSAGIPVCHLRLGVVLSRHGGILRRLLPFFRAGCGATLGSGEQFDSYVSLADAVGAICFLSGHSGASGPYNIAAPEPVTNAQFTAELARIAGPKARLHLPAWALRSAFGEVVSETVLGSLRVVPARLTEAGFCFEHLDVEAILREAFET